MSNIEYTLEFLSEEFGKHAKGEEGVGMVFNLPTALKTIVDELTLLRNRIDEIHEYCFQECWTLESMEKQV